jgi:hypothetical protein
MGHTASRLKPAAGSSIVMKDMDEQRDARWEVARGEQHRHEIGRAKHSPTPGIPHFGGVKRDISQHLRRPPWNWPQYLGFERPNELNGSLPTIARLDMYFKDSRAGGITWLKAAHR